MTTQAKSFLCNVCLPLTLSLILASCSTPTTNPAPNNTENLSQDAASENAADATSPAGEIGLSEFFEDECPFESTEDDPFRCGYLLVPEDRAKEDGLTAEIAVVIIESHSDAPRPDPVLYLEGGPGGSALLGIDDWLESPLRDEREIVLFDQRGTGFSWPNLDCTETDALENGEVDTADLDEGVAQIEAVEACRDRLRDFGVDLTAYNSAASAADVNDLRLALGIDEWNLFGISYGTRLGLTIMRDYPTGVRSVVLDSVYPPNVDAYTVAPQTQADAILALLSACANDADCSEWYPDLEADLYDMIRWLNDEPLETDELFLTGDDVVNGLVSWLYDSEKIAQLPYVISEAAYDNFEPWLDLSEDGFSRFKPNRQATSERRFQDDGDASEDDTGLDDSQGMFYSVECYEEAPFGNLDDARALMETYPPELAQPLLADVEEFYAACAIWGAGEAASIESAPVTSNIRTLLVSGELDPVTPPSWATLAAQSLSNNLNIVIPRGGHSVSSDGDCVNSIIIDFINDLNRAPDISCAQKVRPFEGP